MLALALTACAASAAEPAVVAPAAAVSPQPPAVAAGPAAPVVGEAAPAVAAVAPGPRATAPAEIELPKTELPDALKDDDADTSVGWALVRTVVVLGLVLMIVWLTLNYGLRKILGIRGPVGGASVVSVLERIPLDQKRTLFVVKAAGEYLLLGAGDGAVALVAKLDAQEVEKLSQRPAGGATLSPLLARLLSRKTP